ncbi:MAG TPA: cupin domain-containing protein, partial [Anaerolineae bacterium]|nr:cupin domain-containing protein [Anaerolineae bacterium]
MDAFEVTTLLREHARSDKLYLEFLRKASLSLGLYRLPAGGVDPQSPHTEDELYYVIEGRAQIRVGDEDRSVGPGSIVFVAAP